MVTERRRVMQGLSGLAAGLVLAPTVARACSENLGEDASLGNVDGTVGLASASQFLFSLYDPGIGMVTDEFGCFASRVATHNENANVIPFQVSLNPVIQGTAYTCERLDVVVENHLRYRDRLGRYMTVAAHRQISA